MMQWSIYVFLVVLAVGNMVLISIKKLHFLFLKKDYISGVIT